MPDASYVQSSFLGGEWSKYAQGRFDKKDYAQAMNVCLNSIPMEEGACTRRPGERYICATRSGAAGRLFSFDFEAAAPYLMEFTPGHLRFIGSTVGGLLSLVTTNDAATVTNISTANPAVITLSSLPAGWASNDQVFFNFGAAASSFCPILRNRVFAIGVSGSTFTMNDAITNQPIDGSTIGWGTGPSPGVVVVTAQRVADIPTPYSGNDFENIRVVQSDLGALLLQGAYQPQLLTNTFPTTNDFAAFTLSAATFIDGPYLDPPASGTLTPSALTGTITLSGAPSGTFVSTDVGRMMRLFSQPAQWDVGTTYAADDVVTYQDAFYSALQGTTGNIPGSDTVNWGTATNVAVWVWGLITVVNSDTEVTFDIDDSGLLASSLLYLAPIDAAFGNWQLGLYSETTGYSACGTYYGGRLWLSGAVPNRIDSSMSNKTLVFSPTAVDDTTSDSNGISYIFNATDQNPIFWMQPTVQGIVCGTQSSEWLVTPPTTGPLTPTNIQAHRVTKYGCANIEPRETGLTLTFVQRWTRKLFEYFPDVFSGRYMAPNLSVNAQHITHDGISEIAFQKERTPILWSRFATGALAGTTYKRDSLMSSMGPEFIAWHRHTLGSGRSVISVCTGPSQFNNLDGLAMITYDPTTNIRHVSVLTDLFDEGDLLTSAWYLDDAIVPAGGVLDTAAGTVTFNGLWHLNGKTVSVFCCGLDCGDFYVTNGQIMVPLGDGIENLFSLTFIEAQSGLPSSNAPGAIGLMTNIDVVGPTSAQVVRRLSVPAIIGFTYTSQGQCVRRVNPQEAGAANGSALGKTQRAHQFSALLANAVTDTVSFGTNFGHMRKANFRTKGQKSIPETQLFSGVHQDTLDDEYGFNSMICWEIDRPLPLTVAAFGGFVNTQDR